MGKRTTPGSSTLQLVAAAAVTLVGSNFAIAAVFPEVEPNDSKATATPVIGIMAGDTIVGNSTSATGVGLDYFDVRTAPLALGIYEHRLVITSNTVGHTGTLRGLNQIGAPADTLPGIPWDGVIGTPGTTDTTLQTSATTTTPPRYNQWYGFGKGERLYYRVTGTSSTTEDYTATMVTRPVTATPIGVYQPGLITINTNGQGHTSDTDLWVYDSDFNALPGYGNDDSSAALSGAPIATTSTQSWLARNYAPGTYYLALSNFSTFNNQPSPSDDNFRTGALADFADWIGNSSTTVNLNMTFTIADSAGTTLQVPNTKVSQFDVNWFTFTVVPEPAALGLFAVALPMLVRRRRA